MQHDGIYKVNVKNYLGEVQSTPITIKVNKPPHDTRLDPLPAAPKALDEDAVLECSAKGIPSPSFLWFYCQNTSEVCQQSEYIPVNFSLSRSSGERTYESETIGDKNTLVIRQITSQETGFYECRPRYEYCTHEYCTVSIDISCVM